MIEIDRSKCKKMLVWDAGIIKQELYVLINTGIEVVAVMKQYEEDFFNGKPYVSTTYDYSEPLPEPKPMTALDAMWWAGTRKVFKRRGGNMVLSAGYIDGFDNIDNIEWNELIRENGETKLKYDEWKPFTFDECDMGEG
jgi:hypothetical protein